MDSFSEQRAILQRADCPVVTAGLHFFDIETTGLRPDRRARITEVALLDREGVLLDWKRDPKAQEETFAFHLPELFDHLTAGVVVGHNVRFDLGFVAYVAGRQGLQGPTLRFVDTLALVRKHLNARTDHRLGALVEELGIAVEGELHTALADARATRDLFWKLVDLADIETLAEAGLQQLNWSTL